MINLPDVIFKKLSTVLEEERPAEFKEIIWVSNLAGNFAQHEKLEMYLTKLAGMVYPMLKTSRFNQVLSSSGEIKLQEKKIKRIIFFSKIIPNFDSEEIFGDKYQKEGWCLSDAYNLRHLFPINLKKSVRSLQYLSNPSSLEFVSDKLPVEAQIFAGEIYPLLEKLQSTDIHLLKTTAGRKYLLGKSSKWANSLELLAKRQQWGSTIYNLKRKYPILSGEY